jgi:hypothetical protein
MEAVIFGCVVIFCFDKEDSVNASCAWAMLFYDNRRPKFLSSLLGSLFLMLENTSLCGFLSCFISSD